MSARLLCQTGDFDVAAELARLEALGGGAVASFTGVVRSGGGLQALYLETCPAMIGPALEAIAAQAGTRWPLLGVTLIHRHGTPAIGNRIVLVTAALRHHAAGLSACGFLIYQLKSHEPLWKQERFADGTVAMGRAVG